MRFLRLIILSGACALLFVGCGIDDATEPDEQEEGEGEGAGLEPGGGNGPGNPNGMDGIPVRDAGVAFGGAGGDPGFGGFDGTGETAGTGGAGGGFDEFIGTPCEGDLRPGYCVHVEDPTCAGIPIPSMGCGGSNTVQCCIDHQCTHDNGSSGTCISERACDRMGGETEAGHCPGDDEIRCCAVED